MEPLFGYLFLDFLNGLVGNATVQIRVENFIDFLCLIFLGSKLFTPKCSRPILRYNPFKPRCFYTKVFKPKHFLNKKHILNETKTFKKHFLNKKH